MNIVPLRRGGWKVVCMGWSDYKIIGKNERAPGFYPGARSFFPVLKAVRFV
jgi:hypothetical protein